jgi:hypothetical protein
MPKNKKKTVKSSVLRGFGESEESAGFGGTKPNEHLIGVLEVWRS